LNTGPPIGEISPIGGMKKELEPLGVASEAKTSSYNHPTANQYAGFLAVSKAAYV
jgi:hypothetical protein